METFEIINIEDFTYELKNLNKNLTIELLLEFYEIKPKVGDLLILSKILLDKTSESYVQPYAFIPSKMKENYKEDEVAGLIKNGEKILLKRIYG